MHAMPSATLCHSHQGMEPSEWQMKKPSAQGDTGWPNAIATRCAGERAQTSGPPPGHVPLVHVGGTGTRELKLIDGAHWLETDCEGCGDAVAIGDGDTPGVLLALGEGRNVGAAEGVLVTKFGGRGMHLLHAAVAARGGETAGRYTVE